MSEQNVLGFLLGAAFAAHNLIIGVAFLGGAALAIWAGLRRKILCSIVGVGIAVAPIVTFALNRSAAEQRYVDRQAEVKALRRERLPSDYPRQLLVEGDLAPATAISLIVLGHFDDVEVRETFSTARIFAQGDRGPACATAARQWLDREDRRIDRQGVLEALAQCATTEESVPRLLASADAVVLRTGSTVKHRTKGRIWGGGAVEIVLRRDQSERLIDYRELPYEERRVTITSPLAEPISSPTEALDAAALLLRALAATAR